MMRGVMNLYADVPGGRRKVCVLMEVFRCPVLKHSVTLTASEGDRLTPDSHTSGSFNSLPKMTVICSSFIQFFLKHLTLHLWPCYFILFNAAASCPEIINFSRSKARFYFTCSNLSAVIPQWVNLSSRH